MPHLELPSNLIPKNAVHLSLAEKRPFQCVHFRREEVFDSLGILKQYCFKEPLKISEEEFWLACYDLITLPYDSVYMEYVMPMLRRGVSEDVESALLSWWAS